MLLREVRHVLFVGPCEWLICSVRVQSLGISADGSEKVTMELAQFHTVRLTSDFFAGIPQHDHRGVCAAQGASHLVRRPTTGQEYAAYLRCRRPERRRGECLFNRDALSDSRRTFARAYSNPSRHWQSQRLSGK